MIPEIEMMQRTTNNNFVVFRVTDGSVFTYRDNVAVDGTGWGQAVKMSAATETVLTIHGTADSNHCSSTIALIAVSNDIECWQRE